MSYFFFQELKLFNGSVWNVAKALIDPSGDLFKLALEQAKLKCEYTMAYSQSGKLRDKETKYQRQLMGCLAEIYAEEFFKDTLLGPRRQEGVHLPGHPDGPDPGVRRQVRLVLLQGDRPPAEQRVGHERDAAGGRQVGHRR